MVEDLGVSSEPCGPCGSRENVHAFYNDTASVGWNECAACSAAWIDLYMSEIIDKNAA